LSFVGDGCLERPPVRRDRLIKVRLWLRDGPGREAIDPLPDAVEFHLIPRSGPLAEEFYAAEFLVPPYGSQRVLEALPRMEELRVVQANSSGVEWLLPHVPEGVTVCSARGTRDVAVAEWVLAVILAMTKDLPHWRRQQEAEVWKPELLDELAGSLVLIVGYGSIGEAVEARLAPLEVSVERIANRVRPGVYGVDRLSDLLPLADIVVLLLPSTPSTDGLFDEGMLARMKPDALLVNAGRGTAVDTQALVDAVSEERLRAALDVTDPEPLPEDHPLWHLSGVLVTPHLAGDSLASERRVYRLIGDQVRRYMSGELLINVVKGSAAFSG
jgi:phosphoglycerate dehydrogenase-like enzyme